MEKIIPVHPELAELLRHWFAEGWQEFMGRAPEADDLIVPRPSGGLRTNGYSYKGFRADLELFGLRGGRTHYETRATFRSLAIGGGAPLEALNLITHPSPREASELYTRIEQVWPAMCRAVMAVKLEPGGNPAEGTDRSSVAVPDADKEKARRLSGFGPQTSVSAEGIEPSTYGLRVAFRGLPVSRVACFRLFSGFPWTSLAGGWGKGGVTGQRCVRVRDPACQRGQFPGGPSSFRASRCAARAIFTRSSSVSASPNR